MTPPTRHHKDKGDNVMQHIKPLRLWSQGIAFLVACILAWTVPHTAHAGTPQTKTPKTYQLHLAPLSWWRHILHSDQPGLVMQYSAWQRAWKAYQAQRQHISPSRSAIVLQQLTTTGHTTGQQLHLRTQLHIRVLKRGWHAIDLPLKGIRLSAYQLKGLPGSLSLQCPTAQPTCTHAQKQIKLILNGPGTATLSLDGSTQITTTRKGQHVQFSLPHVPASSLRIKLPPKQELAHAPHTFTIQHKPDATWLLGSIQQSSLQFSFRPLEAGSHQRVMLSANSTETIAVSPHLHQRHIHLRLTSRMGQQKQVNLGLPTGYRVLHVKGPQLKGVQLHPKKRQLSLLFAPRIGKHTLHAHLTLVKQGKAKTIQWQPLHVTNAYEHTGHITFQLHRDLRAHIQHTTQSQRTPLRNTSSSDTTQMRFRFWNAKSQLALAITPILPLTEATPTLSLSLSPRQAQLHVALQLRATQGRLHTFRWRLPQKWQLQQCQTTGGTTPRYWKQGDWWTLQLPKALKKGQQTTVHLSFVTPLTLPTKTPLKWHLPTFQLADLKTKQGTLRVSYPSFYAGVWSSLQQLVEQANTQTKRRNTRQHSFQLLQLPYKGTLTLQRKPSQVQALTVSRYNITQRRLQATTDIYLLIRGSGIQTVSLLLKHSKDMNVQFRTKSNRIVSSHRQPTKDGMRWTLKLAREHFGQLALRASLSRPTTPKGQRHMPTISVVGALFERGFAAITATPHIRVNATTTHLAAIDPLLIPAPLFPSKKQVPLLAYRYQQPNRQLSLQLTPMTTTTLQRAVVRNLTTSAQIRATGPLRMTSRFVLDSKGLSSFQATLPPRSELWSALLDGKGIKPLRKGQVVRIPLPLHSEQKQFNITLHYTTPISALPHRMGSLRAPAPTVTYPIQHTYWNVHTPPTYRSFLAGTQRHWNAQRPRPILEALWRLFKYKTGITVIGIGLLLLLIFFRQTLWLLQWLFRLARQILLWSLQFIRFLIHKWYLGLGTVVVLSGFFVFTSAKLKAPSRIFQRESMPSPTTATKGNATYRRHRRPTSRKPFAYKDGDFAPKKMQIYERFVKIVVPGAAGGSKSRDFGGLKKEKKSRRYKRKKISRKDIPARRMAPHKPMPQKNKVDRIEEQKPAFSPPPPPPPQASPKPMSPPLVTGKKTGETQSNAPVEIPSLKQRIVKKPPSFGDDEYRPSGDNTKADAPPTDNNGKRPQNQNTSPARGEGNMGKRFGKSGLLGTLTPNQNSQIRDILDKTRSSFSNKKTQQQRQMLQWMMRKGEGRMMRGIRSLSVAEPRVGSHLTFSSTSGLATHLTLTLWTQHWLHTMMAILFFLALALWGGLGFFFPRHKGLLWITGVLASSTATLMFSGYWLLLLNAITAGIFFSGLLYLLAAHNATKPTTPAAMALLFALCTIAPTQPVQAAPTPQAKTHNTQTNTQNTRAKDCQIPLFQQQALQQKVRIFAPYKGSASVSPTTPVIVPYNWWQTIQRTLRPECIKAPDSAASSRQAHYTIQATRGKRLTGTAQFNIRLHGEKWLRIPLGLRGMHLTAPPTITHSGPSTTTAKGYVHYTSNGYEAVLQGPGQFQITLPFQGTQTLTKRDLSLSLSPIVAASLTLSLPPNKWELDAPSLSGGFTHTQTRQHTQVTAFVGGLRHIRVRWQPARQTQHARQELAQAVTYTHITALPQLIRVKTRVELAYQHSDRSRFSFQLPQTMLLERLRAPNIRKWSLHTDAKGTRHLRVVLHDAVKQLKLDIQGAILRKQAKEKRILPLIIPEGTSRQTGLIGFRASPYVKMALFGTEWLEKRTPDEYKQATSGWGNTVQEAYAHRRSPKLRIHLQPTPILHRFRANIDVHPTKRTPNAKQTLLQVKGTFTLLPKSSAAFVYRFLVPSSFRITRLTHSRKQGLRHVWFGPKQTQHRTLWIELRKPSQVGDRLHIHGQMESHTSPTAIPLLFPQGNGHVEGILTLHPPLDQELQTEQLNGLEATSTSSKGTLSFLIKKQYQGLFSMEKRVSTARCDGHVSIQVEDSLATLTGTLTYRASNAGKRTWQLLLAKSMAQQVEWLRTPTNSTRTQTRQRNGDILYTWKQINPSRKELLSFRMRLSVSKAGLTNAKSIIPKGVTESKLQVLLKKGTHIRLHLPKTTPPSLEKIDLNEVQGVNASQRKGLVAAYRVKQPDWSLTVKRESLRSQIALQPIVEVAHIETTLSSKGNAWVLATYTARTPGKQQLTLQLPKGAKLLQLLIAGRDLQPAKGPNGTYLLPLPPRQTSDLAYAIKVLYQQRHTPKTSDSLEQGLLRNLALAPPVLKDINIAETFWTVRLPYGYNIAWHKGNMDEGTLLQVAAKRLRNALQFRKQLKKIAAVGSRQQQWRASQNYMQQTTKLQTEVRQLQKQARRSFVRNQRERDTMGKVNQLLRDARSQLTTPQQRQTTPISSTRNDPTAHWKQQFKLGAPQRQTTTLLPQRHGFSFVKAGTPTTFACASGTPQLTLTVYKQDKLVRTAGWFGWGFVLLILVFIGWKTRRE